MVVKLIIHDTEKFKNNAFHKTKLAFWIVQFLLSFSTENKHTQKLCTMVDLHDLMIASGEILSLIDMHTKSTLGIMLHKSTHIKHFRTHKLLD